MPADAFYEWQRLDAKNKQPFAIAMNDGQPYALAGLWERWKDRKVNAELLTFTVSSAARLRSQGIATEFLFTAKI